MALSPHFSLQYFRPHFFLMRERNGRGRSKKEHRGRKFRVSLPRPPLSATKRGPSPPFGMSPTAQWNKNSAVFTVENGAFFLPSAKGRGCSKRGRRPPLSRFKGSPEGENEIPLWRVFSFRRHPVSLCTSKEKWGDKDDERRALIPSSSLP